MKFSILNSIALCMLPCIAYIFIIKNTLPINSICNKISRRYFILGGILSAGIVLAISLPAWTEIIRPENYKSRMDYVWHNILLDNAFKEEISKLFTFVVLEFLIFKYAKLKIKNGVSYMYYYVILGMSFGFIENILYAMTHGDQILMHRSFTSLLIHTLLGAISGYFYALSCDQNIGKRPLEKQSKFSNLCDKYPYFRFIIYNITGIIVVTYLHGIYNFNIVYSGDLYYPILLTQMFMIIIVSYAASRNLINKQNK